MAELALNLQQNLITILCWDDVNGRIVSNVIRPELFEGDLRTLAERAIAFWKKHDAAPKTHTPDLVGDILDDPHNRRGRSFNRIIANMYELKDSINNDYVLDQVRTFTRLQQLKDALIQTSEKLNAQQEIAIADVEAIWNRLLKVNTDGFDAGMPLADFNRMLDYFAEIYAEFVTGIPEFDKSQIVPYRRAVMLILGATGRGKTWGLIHLGKMALLARKKIVHFTGEMGEEQVARRYYQSILGVTKRPEVVDIVTLEKNTLGRLKELGKEKVTPDFHLESPHVRDELEQHIFQMGTKFSNLIIKRFTSFTVDEMEAYLDNLEATQGFIPDMIILDYINLMQLKGNDKRLALGQVFKDFRNLCIRRNAAGVTAQQASKEGAKAATVKMTNVAEAWSLTNDADIVITYSSTDAEHRMGLARLYVGKARDEKDKFGVLITQAYAMGAFVLDSMYLGHEYWELTKNLPKDEEPPEEEEDGEE